MFIHYYGTIRKHSLHNFWRDMVEHSEFLELTDETKFSKKNEEENSTKKSNEDSLIKDEVDVSALTESVKPTNENEQQETQQTEQVIDLDDSSDSELFASDDVECVSDNPKGKGFKLKLYTDPADKEIFCLGRTLGTQDYIGQRVLQIATILRNLSFIEENVPTLLKNDTFVRFFLLCASSSWSNVRNLGLDMLGNVATDFLVKDLPNDKLASYLLKVITYGLQSEDRASCISSLEVLNKLSQNVANEDAMLRNLECTIYERVCSFLTLHDVMLLIYTLECLYSLSSLGERSCNLIVNNHGVVDTLVSLVTVEGKSYGPKACIGMKLVETVPGGGVSTSANSGALSGGSSNVSTTSSCGGASLTVNSSTPATSVVAQASSIKPLTPSTPSRTVQITPQRLIAISPAPVGASKLSF